MRLVKFILLLIILAVLGVPVYIAGSALYYGRDVGGVYSAIQRELSGSSLIVLDMPMLPEREVHVRKAEVTWSGEVERYDLREASGLMVSRSQQDVLFSFNDGGNPPELFALDTHGRHLQSWRIDYDEGHDLEGIAAFSNDDGYFILLADTGDNLYWRKSVTLIIVREPEVETTPGDVVLGVERRIEFTYPGGQRDMEAIAIDEDLIYLISKRRVPAEVFTLDLGIRDGVQQARLVTHLVGIPQPNDRDKQEDPEYGAYRSTVTGLDMQGRHAVVMTYKDAYLYRRKRGQGWSETFSGTPERILLPEIFGLESVALIDNGEAFYVLGERDGGIGRSGLFRVDL